jgi:aminoglycoside/choline kinase family phosphotransferase
MVETQNPEPNTVSVQTWLDSIGWKASRVEMLAGDVSRRRYFRAFGVDRDPVIVATYPTDLRDGCHKFSTTAGLLGEVGVLSPEIFTTQCDHGFMMLQDVGSRTLYDMKHTPWAQLESWFENAVRIVNRIQKIPIEKIGDLNPPLDAALMRKELDQTWDLFLEPNQLVGSSSCSEDLRRELDSLCSSLDSIPPVPCHRDFMARNLVPVDPAPTLVVLDHQDLRPGPRFYDLASLFNDSMFPAPEWEQRFVDEFTATEQDSRLYHQAAAQRSLKAIGTFEMFSRRGNSRHLPLIPPTLGRALHHLEKLPEFCTLLDEVGESWQLICEGSSEPYNK